MAAGHFFIFSSFRTLPWPRSHLGALKEEFFPGRSSLRKGRRSTIEPPIQSKNLKTKSKQKEIKQLEQRYLSLLTVSIVMATSISFEDLKKENVELVRHHKKPMLEDI